MHFLSFLAIFELMLDSLTAIQVELNQCQLKYPVLKSQPVSPEKLKKWWNLVTVDPKDVIETIQIRTYTDVAMNYNVNIPKTFDTTQVELKTFNTHQGKCISVKVSQL